MSSVNYITELYDFFVSPKIKGKTVQPIHSGTTAQRPTLHVDGSILIVGYQYYDTTLGKPVWFKSAGVWVDATGATV